MFQSQVLQSFLRAGLSAVAGADPGRGVPSIKDPEGDLNYMNIS